MKKIFIRIPQTNNLRGHSRVELKDSNKLLAKKFSPTPLLSVILSTYNRLNLLKKTIYSILNQTYKNIEIIIIDDGSKDGTVKFLDEISKRDSRLKVYKNQNNSVLYAELGHTEVLKRLISIKKGDYFITAADDDYYPNKEFFSYAINKLIKNKTLSKVIGAQVNYNFLNHDEYKVYNINEINNFLKNKDKNFYHHNNILPSGFIKKELYLKLFSAKPLDIAISTNGTIFSTYYFEESLSLKVKNFSKWQGAYELLIPSSLLGDIYYINEPCVVIGINSSSLSFGKTQSEHMKDQILSVDNAYKNFYFLKIKNKKNLNLKKQFIYNILNTYIHHSIEIIKNNKLNHCTNENIKEYVNLIDIIYLLSKYKIFKINIKLLIKYLWTKYSIKIKKIFK